MRRLLAALAAVLLLSLLLPGCPRAQATEPGPAPGPAKAPAPATASALAPGAGSWPKFGPGRYTLHYKGRMWDALSKLSQITGVQFQAGRYLSAVVPQDDPDAMADLELQRESVVLDFDNATLEEIVLGICRRYGLVAESSGRTVILSPGDMSKDARPGVDVGDYIVRVTSVVVQPADVVDFRWGRANPEKQNGNTLVVALVVWAKSQAARQRLAALNATARATTDTGEVLQASRDLGAREPMGSHFQREALQWNGTVSFPRPSGNAKKLSRLEGGLMLYTSPTTVDLDLRPGDKGVPVKQGPVTATLKTWNEWAAGVAVEMSLIPPAERAGQSPSGTGGPQPLVTLVAKDGGPCGTGNGTSSFPDPAGLGVCYSASFSLKSPPERGYGKGTPDHLHLHFEGVWEANKLVPFAIENIAIP